MSSFGEFLAEQEKAHRLEIEEQKRVEAQARQLKLDAHQSWSEVQNAVVATTKDEIIYGMKFVWYARTQSHATLVLHNLAAVFQDTQRDLRYTVIFGPIPGNEHLWKSPLPEQQVVEFHYVGEGMWGESKLTGILGGSLNTEDTARSIAEKFTKYYLNLRTLRPEVF
jgi:hypothetical protein